MGELRMTKNRSLAFKLSRVGLHIVLLTLGLLFMFPFVWSISTSLKPFSDLFQTRKQRRVRAGGTAGSGRGGQKGDQ